MTTIAADVTDATTTTENLSEEQDYYEQIKEHWTVTNIVRHIAANIKSFNPFRYILHRFCQ